MHNSKALLATFISLFAGAVVAELQSMMDAGHMDFSTKSLSHMAVTGVVTAAIALYHLYQPSPSNAKQ